MDASNPDDLEERVARDPDRIADDAIEDWTAHGLRCIVRPGGYCLNGYVRLPDAFIGKTQILCAVRGAIFHAYDGPPITYGPWEDSTYNPNWIGFFTGHDTDYWAPDDLIGLLTDEAFTMAQTVFRISSQYDKNGAHRWTRERLRACVEQLALAISSLRGPSEVEIAPNG